MAKNKRARFVALTSLLSRRYRELDNVAELIARGGVIVDGGPVLNPAARVRADAAIRVVGPARLRGEVKLSSALTRFGIEASERVALDVGAAAGGFTQALLTAGAARVYAVDAGHGQLAGWLRNDSRVVNLEGINLGELDQTLVPDTVDLVTMDLSYLSVAEAVPQLDGLRLADDADLVALIKPTFELHTGALAAQPGQVASAVRHAGRSIEQSRWLLIDDAPSPIAGRRGAVETFLHARRSTLSD